MPAQQKPFDQLDYTPELISSLLSASSAIGALDARVSASPMAAAWKRRASWTGYAAALRLQNEPFEEIDVIAHLCDFTLPAREKGPTTGEVFTEYEMWSHTVLGDAPRAPLRGEGEGALFAPDVPAILRALTTVDLAARADMSIRPWLALPSILSELLLTSSSLPCLVIGDHGQRFAREPRMVVLRRLLAQLRSAAEEGVERLNRLEQSRALFAAAIRDVQRPGALPKLAALFSHEPALAPIRVARVLSMSRAGAGKLLGRAAELGLVRELSGRDTWKVFLARDIVQSIGLEPAERGRPKKIDPYDHDLAPALTAFDEEMAEIDALLSESSGRKCS
ncbi:MAG: hypothetical protein AAF683_00445 [Pseudomonadota bacterium]